MGYPAAMSPFPAYAAALRNLRLPLAYVDLALFDKNAADLVRRVRAGTGRALPIRPASKSIRCVTLMDRLLTREGYAGLMCYSAGEAAWLSRELAQPTHLLVAYPTLERADIRACLEACDAGALNSDNGACTSLCAIALCGDGLVQAGVETCDCLLYTSPSPRD